MGRRLDYIDGLRGVAVALVIIYHCFAGIPHASQFGLLAEVAKRGQQGVSLFLVLSGFCLSYPVLTRRAAGETRLFVLSEFFARRSFRILPSYYVAFAFFLLVGIVAGAHVSSTSILAHLLLLHNNVPSMSHDVASPFWSLGLEWQWYWVFPLLLFLTTRSPGEALTLCLALAVFTTMVMFGIEHVLSWEEMLPQRLFEFACGIVVAQALVKGRKPPAYLLLVGLVMSLALANVQPIGGSYLGPIIIQNFGLLHPLYGCAFALLILLAATNGRAHAALSWRPLIGLGIASYSVYLIHGPVIEGFEGRWPALLGCPALTMFVAAACGLAAGLIFHRVVERHLTSQRAAERVLPLLRRLFLWMDRASPAQSVGHLSDDPVTAATS